MYDDRRSNPLEHMYMAHLRIDARVLAATVILGALASLAAAQPPAVPPAAAPAPGGRGGARGPAVASPEVSSERRVTFRIFAPRAESVTINAGDIPGANQAPPFAKGENGVWEMTLGPLTPGAFRYVFIVDGVRTLDPVNTRTAESNTSMWSLFHIPGLDAQDAKPVPHGAVASVFYDSTVVKTLRRMHVYTPPGYESGKQKYPVFYLLHGAGDTDDAWTSVGRAGFILDNLIAAGRMAPMIVVMPAGHQPSPAGAGAAVAPQAGAPAGPAPPPTVNPFTREFVSDVMPYVEGHYRTLNDRAHRAIAGLSMGGSQTLDIAFRHLARFAYIGVFSSGATLGGGRGAAGTTAPTPPRPDWASVHAADLDNRNLKKGTRLVWFSTGVDDGLMSNTRSTVEMLRQHGFAPELVESPGGHTWLNWREYLVAFAPRLFR